MTRLIKYCQLIQEGLVSFRSFAVVAFMSNLSFVFFAVIVLPFVFLEPVLAFITLTTLAAAYSTTYLNLLPRSKWSWFRRGFVTTDTVRYFKGEVKAVTKLDSHQQYVFAMAPHGIMVSFSSLLLSSPCPLPLSFPLIFGCSLSLLCGRHLIPHGL
jgi:hypothetical protein